MVATPGAEPKTKGGYSAVALLEGDRFFGHSDLRAAERARNQFFNAASLSAEAGKIFVAIDPVHPIVPALIRWDSSAMLRRELSENEEVHLPPYFRFISIEVESSDASTLQRGFDEALRSSRIPSSTRIHGPYEISRESSRFTISAEVSEAPTLVNFIHELQRRRSLSHKSLMKNQS